MYATFQPSGLIDLCGDVPFGPEAIEIADRRLLALERRQLGLVKGKVIDLATLGRYFIDQRGQKHPSQADPSWPQLKCGWNDPLALVDGMWRVARPSDQIAPSIRREFDRRIGLALDNKGQSMIREAVYLQTLVAAGKPLSAEQQAEVTMFTAINDWEARMIDAREALIAAAEPSYADSAHWPAPPEGLAAFMSGF